MHTILCYTIALLFTLKKGRFPFDVVTQWDPILSEGTFLFNFHGYLKNLHTQAKIEQVPCYKVK